MPTTIRQPSSYALHFRQSRHRPPGPLSPGSHPRKIAVIVHRRTLRYTTLTVCGLGCPGNGMVG
jgi:hypothetical protein